MPLYDLSPGLRGELAYAEITSNVSVTVVAEASAVTVITLPAFVADGATTVLIEAYAPQMLTGGSVSSRVDNYLWDGATSLGFWGSIVTPAANNMVTFAYLARRLIPAAGSHSYIWKANATVSAGQIQAGAGGAGANQPGWMRATVV